MSLAERLLGNPPFWKRPPSYPYIDDDLNRKLNLDSEKISLPANRKRALQVLLEKLFARKWDEQFLVLQKGEKLEQAQVLDEFSAN